MILVNIEKLSKKEFQNLIEFYNINIEKKSIEYFGLEHKINSEWLQSSMSKEDSTNLSKKYHKLAKTIKKDFRALKDMKKEMKRYTSKQKNVVNLIFNWSNSTLKSYRFYSRYLTTLLPDYREDFLKFKREAENIKDEYQRWVERL